MMFSTVKVKNVFVKFADLKIKILLQPMIYRLYRFDFNNTLFFKVTRFLIHSQKGDVHIGSFRKTSHVFGT